MYRALVGACTLVSKCTSKKILISTPKILGYYNISYLGYSHIFSNVLSRIFSLFTTAILRTPILHTYTRQNMEHWRTYNVISSQSSGVLRGYLPHVPIYVSYKLRVKR